MSGWEQRIVTGNPQADHATVEQHRQAAAAQGLAFDAQPLPTGGYYVRAYAVTAGGTPAPPGHQQGYPQQPQQQQWGGAPGGMTFSTVSHAGSAASGAGGVVVGGGVGAAAAPLTQERVRYLRKVYGLLFASVIVAGLTGFAATSLGPTEYLRDGSHKVAVPILTYFLLSSRVAMYAAFGLLFVATLAAGAVSKVRGLNLVALFGVAALMGVEVAPMVFVAQYLAHTGHTMTSAPVVGAFLVTAAAFAGATSYVFITRKDFSYLGATLSMGFWVVFAGSFVAIFINREVFTLAICSVGALVAGGMLLLQTSRIFRTSQMDDAVGDCLALLVQLRNLFVFVLRILMSSRR
jgi:modulator of FtsH protease